MMVGLPILMIWWMNRSQRKRQEQIETNVKLGDRVLLQSGMIGTIARFDGRLVQVEIAPGVKITALKSSIQGPVPGDLQSDGKTETKAEAKK